MKESPRGWLGVMRQVLYALSTVNADKDSEGKYLVRGDVISFLGLGGENAEVLIAENAEYYVQGKPYSLVGLMRATSYGVACTVIA
jgi:hypothetical protein